MLTKLIASFFVLCNNYIMNKQEAKEILEILDKIFPDAKCELNYTTPFELLVAVILSAQCTDKRVNRVTEGLFKQYFEPRQFADLSVEELSKYIFSCGFYKNKAEAIIDASKALVEKYNGEVPDNFEDLISLRGVGRKTANVILSEAFRVPRIAVDTHVLRTANRLGFVSSDNPLTAEKELMRYIDEADWSKAHHLFIFFGRYKCSSRNPKCSDCELKKYCKYRENKNV